MNNEKVAFYVTLHGEVQGIGLRKRLESAAQGAHVTGWVCNMPAGHVEAFFEGRSEQINWLLSELQSKTIAIGTNSMMAINAPAFGYEKFSILKRKNINQIFENHAELLTQKARYLSKSFASLHDYLMETTRVGVELKNASSLVRLANEIPSRYLGEPLVKRQKRLPFDLIRAVSSFASESWGQRAYNPEFSKIYGTSVERLLDDKVYARQFANRLNVRVPTIYQSRVPLSELSLRPGIVIKPARASTSRGVFIFNYNGEILSLGDNRVLTTFDEFMKGARAFLQQIKRPDLWISEELILNDQNIVPNDLKVLTFYGKAALVQEETRMPNRYCYFNRSGEQIRTGRYLDREFDGTGLVPGYVELAEAISLKIPAAFCRIDFLKAREGPVFCEFTPKPGNFHQFNQETDTWLGLEYAQARARLDADLLSGKKFNEFIEFSEGIIGAGESRSALTT